MADNITTTPGTGATIAADDVGGILHQRIKLGLGADGAAADLQGPDADGLAASRNLPAGGMRWNGASWDRERGNLEGTLLASAARTVSTASALQTNYNHRGVILELTVTSAGTGTVSVFILSGTGAALAAYAGTTVTTTYVWYPGVIAADVTAVAKAGVLPRSWHGSINKSDGSSWTCSLTYALIV